MTAGKIIRKTKQESRVFNYDPNNLSMEECERIYQEDLASGNPIFTEDQVSVISSIMNDLRQEFDDKLASALQEFEHKLDSLRVEIDMREEMAHTRGQLQVITSILGVNGEVGKTIDVSEVIRKIRVEQR
jgi:hypothetical protein